MTGNEIMAFIGKAVTAVGGVSVIAACVCRIMEKRMEQRFDAKLKKELEKYKAEIGKKQYVSKTRFDTEFELYRKLSEAFFDTVRKMKSILVIEEENENRPRILKEERKRAYFKFSNNGSTAMLILYQNMAFIPENFFERYSQIMEIVGEIHTEYLEFDKQKETELTEQDIKKFQTREYEAYELMDQKLKALNIELREYLKTLEIIQ